MTKYSLGALGFAMLALTYAVPMQAIALPATTAELPTPLPEPYVADADPRADISAALARAKARGARVMIEFGGNWCPDCRVLAGVLALPEAAPKIQAKFETVAVDVGRINKNLDVAQAYGLTLKGVPAVVVLDAAGKVVPNGLITTLSDARGMTPASIFETIMNRAAP